MSEIDTPAEYEPDDDMDLGWQPIETAPKDGTDILVVAGNNQFVAFWGIYDAGIEWWHVTDNKHGPYPLRGQSPTHWMPLPKPPEAP